MKEHPILFQTDMVQAILQGRKTMTRRLFNPQPMDCGELHKQYTEASWKNEPANFVESITKGFWYCQYCGNGVRLGDYNPGIKCPYGTVGDVLWVRETWNERNGEYAYKASPDLFKKTNWFKEIRSAYKIANLPTPDDVLKWKPSIFMPRVASRITLKITNIKVERVQDISEEDAIKEGVFNMIDKDGNYNVYWDYIKKSPIKGFLTAKESFRSLWISINGQESWDSNPFCWCVEFEKI